ncbi:DExH-box ATP-dependent RNA helicase [Phytophthora cactorum]|uniref:DExH-box ATP-dependent RNA helicase n=1 Tax=Phytophthora cactorum TaxID=29920 RepID=A0A329SLV8_9STRA|nr:DExH-box ATP-dependent RNA helicase [Phytophthora cactorum]KAG2806759.1 DExH-box ATP-dependent RNA helicase [Phytophthora cactorum]KAG2846290.1 DExH-box ATP-dependent RNA helicase [Phytophthora cactorum]KAG2855335.1 DExH-box ATP-dependent RNA helicase [Phytophthora cactorum]KAG2900747.1 DExH-box ATP-dependent RNA helicase [Phytophthora cactorum]
MAAVEHVLAELSRLNEEALASPTPVQSTPSSNAALDQFSVLSASSLAPEAVAIVPHKSPQPLPPSSPFALPPVRLTSPYGDRPTVQKELKTVAHPLFALERLGPFPRSWKDSNPESNPKVTVPQSRLLAQMPMSAPWQELVPKRNSIVKDPLKIQYEFRAVDVSRTGADAGFSSALTKQDEYARGKMSNKPFSPGGDSLAELETEKTETELSPMQRLLLKEEEQKRNLLVLGNGEGLDETVLESLVFDVPGINGCLTAEDVKKIEKNEVEQVEEVENVGVNPKSLLKPYFEAVADKDNVAAIRSAVLDEKAANAMRQNDDNTTVGLDQLLREMEDDGELMELGFSMEDNEEEAGKDERHNGDTNVVSSAVKTADKGVKATSGSSTDADSIEDPETELETILDSAAESNTLTLQKRTSPTSEWASMASVDVRNFHEKVPEMAMKYEFELDVFQKECVIHLERHECVFVAAHTSAGKTVIAEYAIAMSQKHMTRTIYTSPIKALSNQKYRDFRTKFGPDNVGLITGDVSINPDASCLVMTTEILRSMLYRGADIIRDIEWVIFDEIHYINDSERGVVWEEVIIMLPEHIGMVFLSATTPNHLEFSDWIGRTKKQKIHVISTYKRPVPLQHFLYAGKELFKLYDASTGYLPNAHGAAKAKLFPASDKSKAGGRGGRAVARGGGSSANARSIRASGGDQGEWTKLINTLKDKSLLPVVVFAFSKRLCEESASKLAKLDLSSPSERSEIHLFLETSVQRLQGSDRELPQVLTMKEMLKRGIGVHHGGLLPIIKEMVEILFGRGLVKVLFSTETFAMGVNMPARTVVFNGIRKHDGKNFRDLLPGEYTQMAGRAGRRGLDSVGTVIIACWSDVPEPTSLRTMLAGKATSLSSQFRLTYNMILNLLRVEVLTVEDMMKRSFSEFHTQKALASKNIPKLIQKGKSLLQQLERSLVEDYPHLEASGELAQMQEFYQLKRDKRELEKKLTKWLLANNIQAAKNAIAPGRIVILNVKGLSSDQLALVVRTNAAVVGDGGAARSKLSFETELQSTATSDAGQKGVFKSIMVLTLCPDDYEPPKVEMRSDTKKNPHTLMGGRMLRSKKDDDDRMFGRMGKKGKTESQESAELTAPSTATLLGRKYAVLEVPESCVESVTSIVASTVNTKTLVSSSSKKELASSIEFLTQLEKDAATTQKAAITYVDLMGELKVNDLEVATGYTQWQQMYSMVLSHPCGTDSPSVSRVMGKVEKIFKLKAYLVRMTRELSNDSLSLFPDFQQRLSVLKRLGYISEDGVVQVKGRVACEINTCEELVLTEMIFENVLANLEPEEIVAVLSALIFQEKSQSEPALTPTLENTREVVKNIAESLGLIQLEQHLEIDPAVYCKGALNFGLMEVVYEWARGMPFKQLCELTDVQEGSIVRCITRLDEVCREVRNAARVIGDPQLYRKMEVASEAIKRDVVFASSLYLS